MRNAMEEKILEAHGRGDLSAVIPRFPDFFGPGVDNRLVCPIFRAAMAGKRVLWPGNADVPHDFIFIGDAARAAILLGSEPKAHGEAWHVPGEGPLTGRQLVEEIARQAGKKPALSVAGPGLLRLAALFDGEVREFLEVLYQFQEPLLLDGQKFLRAFPHFRFTPHPEAIQETIRWFQRAP